MPHKNAAIALFDTHTQAEEAVRELSRAGFDVKTLSIVGRGYHTEDDVVGYYSTGDRVKYWGANGAFWGGMWGLLFGSAVFMIPGIGPIVAAGPVVAWTVAALESAVLIGGLSALGAGLYSIGVPKNSILEYETAIKAGKYMLIAHGTPDDVRRAEGIIALAGAASVHPILTRAPVASLINA